MNKRQRNRQRAYVRTIIRKLPWTKARIDMLYISARRGGKTALTHQITMDMMNNGVSVYITEHTKKDGIGFTGIAIDEYYNSHISE